MTASPRVSVVITTYNRPQLLADALASVCAQTFTDYEIIVVNDHPESRQGVTRITADLDVQLLSPETNLGVSAARNLGMAKAVGEIIALLDDDDTWLPTYLERHVKRHDECPQAAVVYCGYIKDFSPLGLAPRELLASPPPPPPPPPPGDPVGEMLAGRFTLASNSIVSIKSSVLEVVGDFDPSVVGVEGWDLMLRLAQHGELAHIPDPLTVYREHADPRISMCGRDRPLVGAERKWASYPESAEFFRRVRAEVAFDHSRLAGLVGSRTDAWRSFGLYLRLGRGVPGYGWGLLKLLLLNAAGPSVYRWIRSLYARTHLERPPHHHERPSS